MPIPPRLAASIYLLAKRREQARSGSELENLADRFEQIDETTLAEIRSLRSEVARVHMIEDALACERDEHAWLH